MPLWYDDPWSAELAKRFNVKKNIDFVAECNDITVDEAIARHTGTDYWIVCVGFTPGCYFSLPLDPTKWLKAPKYRTPRSYTPARLRRARRVLDRRLSGGEPRRLPADRPPRGQHLRAQPKNAVFPEDGVLLQAGDRLRYFNVNALEYDDIWSEVEAGDYDYDVEEEDFDVPAYLAEHQREPSTA